jgi:flagellar protein FlaF
MGFSTSGSMLVIFIGAFIALGAVYTASSNATEAVSESYSEQLAAHGDIQETAIDVRARYHEADTNLTVRADNVGSVELSVSATDVLVDGEYTPPSGFGIGTVDGNETDVWGQQEQLRLENDSAVPERIHVVTETGVTGTAAVVVVSPARSNPQTLDRTANETESTIGFDLTSSYKRNITLQSVTIEAVDNATSDPAFIEYSQNASLSELNITLAPDQDTAVATADGNFAIGETISHDGVTLEPDGEAQYLLGEFRASDGTAVPMPTTTVTLTITFEDPEGVVRTYTFTEDGF